jgi:Ala-tRNA(Pro) deacylase
MNGDPHLYHVLNHLAIPFEYHEHPPAPTTEIALQYWGKMDSGHCKNLFFRNHKGNRHYLVILDYRADLNVKVLESLLKQGKLSFASEQRMQKYLGLSPGSVSPFGLIHDTGKHVHLFIDEKLKTMDRLSFHPLINTASLVIAFSDLLRFLDFTGNSYEFIQLY